MKSKPIILQAEPYFFELEEQEQNDFLSQAKELFQNATLRKIIHFLARQHFDRAAMETRDWSELISERGLGAGNVEVEQELERWSFEYDSRLKEKDRG